MAIRFDYSRGGRHMSLRRVSGLLIGRTAVGGCGHARGSAVGRAQYPGQVSKNDKDSARAARHCRAGVDRRTRASPRPAAWFPWPCSMPASFRTAASTWRGPSRMALAGEVEYELEQNGQPWALRHRRRRPAAGLVGGLRRLEADAERQAQAVSGRTGQDQLRRRR